MAVEGMYRPRDTRRAQLAGEITDSLRRYAFEAQHIGHGFAALHGLNGTDLQALIAVMDAERVGSPLTPGRLGEQLNLSSGSVTALVDRLERAGHLRRDRDTHDRRKVFLHYAQRGMELALAFFQPLGRRNDEVMAEFTDDELAVVQRFLASMVDSMRDHRAAIESARPESGRRPVA